SARRAAEGRCAEPAPPAARCRARQSERCADPRGLRRRPRVSGKAWDNQVVADVTLAHALPETRDRKSTRLNSSHQIISYAVFCFARHPTPPSFPTRRSSDLLHDALRKAGAPNQLLLLPGAGHGNLNAAQTREAYDAVRAFLAKLGIIK